MVGRPSLPKNPRQLIRTKDVLALLSISRTTLFRIRSNDPTFPLPIKDGNVRSTPSYYVLDEIEAWVQKRMDGRLSPMGTDD